MATAGSRRPSTTPATAVSSPSRSAGCPPAPPWRRSCKGIGVQAMNGALRIHFHGMEVSEALEARTRERFTLLERRCPEVTGCRVTVEKESRHHVKGNLFKIGLLMHLPGR